MPEPDFARLGRQLAAAGVAPRYVRRAVDELAEHYEDLAAEYAAAGYEPGEANTLASRQLGHLGEIGRELAERPQLRCWYYRWPQLGRVVLPVACVAALPFAPVAAMRDLAPELLRWFVCVLLSGLFTAGLFALLQYSITPG